MRKIYHSTIVGLWEKRKIITAHGYFTRLSTIIHAIRVTQRLKKLRNKVLKKKTPPMNSKKAKPENQEK